MVKITKQSTWMKVANTTSGAGTGFTIATGIAVEEVDLPRIAGNTGAGGT
jgi:hypothetical protein